MDEAPSKLQRKLALGTTFTPAAPVSRRDAFSGRYQQINDIVTAVVQPGKHVVLYGERGVGKTSLANILSELLIGEGDNRRDFAKRITCNAGDTFRSIWRRALTELGIEIPDEWMHAEPNPDDLRRTLAQVDPPMVLVLDEYDRVDDDDSLSRMADLLKSLSDHVVTTKIVIVGVSDSIDALIGEHESVSRAIEQVQMPRMSSSEIIQVVNRGFEAVSMSIQKEALVRITKVSEGLPTYAHLLSLEAGIRAVEDDRQEVTTAHVDQAMQQVLDKHSNRSTFAGAVQSSRPDALYAQVLIACALAPKDELGYFPATAVREPLSRIMGKPYETPAFAKHLNAFMEYERGSILQRTGPERSFRYRFRDPLLQPYALLAGITRGIIPEDLVGEIFRPDPETDWDELLSDLIEGTSSTTE